MPKIKKTLKEWCEENNRIDLLAEWDCKNNALNHDEISPFSHKDIFWICTNGHQWSAHLDNRVDKNSGCPYCSGRLPIKGTNDLETHCKNNNLEYLLDEWNYEKNKKKPDEVTPFSNKRAYWICRFCGNEWDAVIGNRTNGRGCKKCNARSTSFPEQSILFYLKKVYTEVIHRYTNLGAELDIYIPSVKIAIEYDGVAYHKTKERTEQKKNKLCKDNNITLIRIREKGLCSYDDCICIFREDPNTKQGLDIAIKALFNYLQIDGVDINTQKDDIAIVENYHLLELTDSLALKYPDIAKEWHPTLNGKLKPENFSCGSGLKVWWKCHECGHSWPAIIGSRTNLNSGCPKCAQQNKYIKDDNKLETWCKQNNKEYILEEFDYEKNHPLTPEMISYGHCKKIWWKCRQCGYQWRISPNKRTFLNCGCRLCSHIKSVRCIETGEIFNSVKLAAEFCNLKKGDKISMCCKGKRKTAGGYHWEYVDETDKNNI